MEREASKYSASASEPPHTVFLSYSRADREHAIKLVHILEDAGFHTWWDGLLEGGERFANTTETALNNAQAVVVLWSPNSTGSHWVHDEATRGRDTGRLVPLSLDGSPPPLGFGQFQAIDISGSLGKPDSGPMQNVLRAVEALHGQDARPFAAAMQTSSGIGRRQILLGTGAAVVVIGGGLLAWRGGDLIGGADAHSIAVLPFENLSGDSEQSYFSDGLTTEIRTRLARNALLEVVGQTSSESAGEQSLDAKSIAGTLGVAYLLSGSVQKSGDTVKIAAELTEGRTGLSKWSDSYQRSLTDIFALQSEIGNAVASSLSVAMGEMAGGQEGKQVGGTTNVAAFDAFLRGRELYEAGIDENSDRAALDYFDRAISLDQVYAGAHAARSRALVIIGNLYSGSEERARFYDGAVTAAQKATKLAPDFAEGFSALGFSYASGQLDIRAASKPFLKSYQLAPGDADILSRYATHLSHMRQDAEAKPIIEKAAKLDPLNARTFRSSGDVSYGAGDYPAAIAAYEKMLALNPTLSGANSSLGFAQMLAGKDEAAAASFAKENSAVRRLPGLAIIAHRKDDQSGAQALLDELVREYGDKSNYQYAQVYAQWGESDKALAALERAWKLRDGGIMLMYNDPLLMPLRGSQRYRELAKAVGFI